MYLLLLFLGGVTGFQDQNGAFVTGKVVHVRTQRSLSDVSVTLEGTNHQTRTDQNGHFKLYITLQGDLILKLTFRDYVIKRMPINLEGSDIDLGTVYLEPDVTVEQADNLITLTDSELLDDGTIASSTGLLQATRDVFLNRAAFDFGQAFFRVRGYDSRNGRVLINGIPMNRFFDGRPQWNNWGGLNDVIRNQEFTNGLAPSDGTFGSVLGVTNINTRPTGLRPGTRLSAATSNRTYRGRLMATFSSGNKESGLAYSVSASRRWAAQGYIEGTLYDAFSIFGTVEYRLHPRNTIHLTAFLASNRRGRSSAITEEVFQLAGKRYNPYWGEQNGKIRNSRERKIEEPIVMFNHYYQSNRFRLNTGASFQFGTNARSRLGYFDAPNPDATFYRYLPSFYVNSPIGANFISANLAREGFQENPQINWGHLYTANTAGRAAYLLYDDVARDQNLCINTIGNLKIGDALQIDFGATYRNFTSENYGEIQDVLGADFHKDIDPFSNTRNDVNGPSEKVVGDIFNYHYQIKGNQIDAFAQLKLEDDQWNGFVAGSLSSTEYQREGLFQNERFPQNSLGKSRGVQFSGFGIKGGFTYRFTGRHWVVAQGALLAHPPVLRNVFINPRENNELVPDIQNEVVSTVDLNYHLRLPKLTGRITGYYTRFQGSVDINYFFVDAGVGSDFVQEVLTDLDKLHAGVEVGLEYQVSSSVKVNAVASVGKQVYASNPSVSINFDTAGPEEDLINLEGFVDLGSATMKDLKLAQGPQGAYALGVEYRDPKYWWFGATANYLAKNYAQLSSIIRTSSFYLNPETGQQFPDATETNAAKLLQQRPLDNFYLLNLVGGKSWLKNGKYISVFISINNLFDTTFRTGGFEQSRNGNFGQMQQDNLSGTPSFAPKYWYGYGRTYFLNMAISF